MHKNWRMVVGIVIGLIILAVLLHIGVNWLIPMVQKLHGGAGA